VTVPAAFSSLRELFVGDDEEEVDPVYQPGLVALLCDSMADPPSSFLAAAERIYPELVDYGPRTATKYMELVGQDAIVAIRDGYDLWRKQRGQLVNAA
jgi:hypothetical protein